MPQVILFGADSQHIPLHPSANPDHSLLQRECVNCGDPFLTNPGTKDGARHKTCSDECARDRLLEAQGKSRKRVRADCETCGESVERLKSQVEGSVYCSRECSAAAQRDRTVVSCGCCGRDIERVNWQIERSDKFFCDDCYGSRKREVECEVCAETVHRYPADLGKRVFCSRECAGKGINDSRYADRSDYVGEYVDCDTCGAEVYREPNQLASRDSHYCSRDCFADGHRKKMSGENNPVWRGGYEPYYGPNWEEQRQSRLEADDYECQRCGLDQDDADSPLHVHHIKPLRKFDRNFSKANSLNNLVTLCEGCHKAVEWNDFGDWWCDRKEQEHKSGQRSLLEVAS